MARDRTADEVKDDHIKAMGADLGSVYHELQYELLEAHVEWLQYRQLFASSEERIDLLNETAGHFFGMLQRVMYENVMLHIARMLEGPRVSRHDVLGLPQLPGLIDDSSLSQDISRLIDEAKSYAKPILNWRHNRLAHRNLVLAMAGNLNTGVSRSTVEQALDSIRQVMHRLESHYIGSQTIYDVFTPIGDADCLCDFLERGAKAYRQSQELLAQGKLPEDF